MGSKLAGAQNAAKRRSTLCRMEKRFGKWWQLWMALTVVWTLAAAASAWLDLPRAPNVPHDPEFLNRLSTAASSIMRGPEVAATRERGAFVWSDTPRILRMENGALLEFPAITTDQRAAIVADEYRQLLTVAASDQRWPFLLERLILWLAPLLVAGVAVTQFRRNHPAESERTKANRAAPPFHASY